MKLSRIKKKPLRTAWPHEALDFTKWLAEEENLALLSDAVGLDISLIEVEASVGKFSVDILAEEENTGRKIIIENQLEITDHDHLGKIITYASGYGAEIVIWIVQKVREEHQKAIDWLNEVTDEKINFFAIEIELLQIGDSEMAPSLKIIAEPNDWAKQLKVSTQKQGVTETKARQLEFWNQFKEFSEKVGTKMSLRKAHPQHWYDIGIGSSLAWISLTNNTRKNEIACELYIGDSQELFEALYDKRQQIEQNLGDLSLEWLALEGRKACRIKVAREANLEEMEYWDEYNTWLKDMAERFYKVFSKEIRVITNG